MDPIDYNGVHPVAIILMEGFSNFLSLRKFATEAALETSNTDVDLA